MGKQWYNNRDDWDSIAMREVVVDVELIEHSEWDFSEPIVGIVNPPSSQQVTAIGAMVSGGWPKKETDNG
jgi:hypothetical protein